MFTDTDVKFCNLVEIKLVNPWEIIFKRYLNLDLIRALWLCLDLIQTQLIVMLEQEICLFILMFFQVRMR